MAATVGKASSVAPGSMAKFEVDGEPVAVANAGGKFYAFSDTCTHVGCSLSESELEGTVVTCSCHGSQFDITSGEVLHGPARTPVKTYAVEVAGDDIQIES